MTNEAKIEIRKMLDKCGDKLLDKLVADPFFDTVRRNLPKNAKPALIFERCVDYCALQRFWNLMQHRERERTARCFGLTASDFPERMTKQTVNEFVSTLDDALLSDYMTLLNLKNANRDNRDEVRRLANDELILSGVLYLLTHVKSELMREIAKALGIAFSDSDSDGTVADWIMCVSHNLDPVPGGKLPVIKGEPTETGRSTRSSANKKQAADEMKDDGDNEEEQDEDEDAKRSSRKRNSTAKGKGNNSRAKAEEEKEEEEEVKDEEEEEERPEKRRRLSANKEEKRGAKKGKGKEEEEEEEEEEKGEGEGDDEHPADRGYYTEDGKWVHPSFDLVMQKKFDAQGLNNNFNLPDLLEFCKLHSIPVASAAKKKGAVIRIVLQFVQTGSVPSKRKSSVAKKTKGGKKDEDEKGEDGEEEEEEEGNDNEEDE